VCTRCGLQEDHGGRFSAIVPEYKYVYRRRFNQYSRAVRFAVMLERLPLGEELYHKVMGVFHIFLTRWKQWDEKPSRYIMNRRVVISTLLSRILKSNRVPQLKNNVSEAAQVKNIHWLLDEFTCKPQEKKKDIWDLFS